MVKLNKEQKQIFDSFPFSYVGGGYFRRKGVEKGKKADIVHGDDVVKLAILQARGELDMEEEFDKS